MVPEIQSVTETIFCHFGPFCPITLLTTQKIKSSKKEKKVYGDITILYKCTINEDHMMYVVFSGNLFRKNLQLIGAFLILDLKPFRS